MRGVGDVGGGCGGCGRGWWRMWEGGGHKKINATNHLAFIYVFCLFFVCLFFVFLFFVFLFFVLCFLFIHSCFIVRNASLIRCLISFSTCS